MSKSGEGFQSSEFGNACIGTVEVSKLVSSDDFLVEDGLINTRFKRGVGYVEI